MRILITGLTGYIGSFIMEKLEGNITGVDNMTTQRYCSLFNRPKNIEFIESHFEDLTVEFISQFDLIIHLAAIVDAANSSKNKELIKKVNIDDTKDFLRKCIALDKTIVWPSSTSVYGSNGIVNEESSLNPQSYYAESKIEVEEFLIEQKAKTYILRLGTIFGLSKGWRRHTVVNKLAYQAALNQPLTIWKNNVDLARPYLGLYDFLKALDLIIHSKPSFGIYNILTDNYKLSYILSLIKNVIPSITINYVDTPLLNQESYIVNFDKIKKIGYSPTDIVEQAIISTINLLS